MNHIWIEHKFRIAQAPFCAFLYIKSAKDFPDNTIPETERWKKPKKNNVQFLTGRSPTLPRDFSGF